MDRYFNIGEKPHDKAIEKATDIAEEEFSKGIVHLYRIGSVCVITDTPPYGGYKKLCIIEVKNGRDIDKERD